MRFVVIGLGSMGKRRIRNLFSLGYDCISGIDISASRRQEAEQKFNIDTYLSLSEAMLSLQVDAIIVSTPPDCHLQFIKWAKTNNVACFIEASVVGEREIAEVADELQDHHVIVPSCTMRYYNAPKSIRKLISEKAIGNVLNINYVVGQYLPDWHPWEHISDYYVSKRETGGCRELVPFELTWLIEIFGDPEPLCCMRDKCSALEANIDDIYHCILKFESGPYLNLTVEVLSRPKATRELILIGSEGKISFSSQSNELVLYQNSHSEPKTWKFDAGNVERDYINPEEPYICEMRDFVDAVQKRDRSLFPNTLKKDSKVLNILNKLEALSV